MKYDPLIEPDPERWLETDEAERLHLVLAYHRRVGVELPNEHLHSVIHTIVENQAAHGDKTPVAQTLGRLMNEGLDRHNAIHAVGSVLVNHLWELMNSDVSETDDLHAVYFDQVRDLTAQKWLDEYEEMEN